MGMKMKVQMKMENRMDTGIELEMETGMGMEMETGIEMEMEMETEMRQCPPRRATQRCRSLGWAQDLELSFLSSHPLQKQIILTCLQMSWSVILRKTIHPWAPMIRGPLSACPQGAPRSWAHPQAGMGTATRRDSYSTPSTSPLTRYGIGMGIGIGTGLRMGMGPGKGTGTGRGMNTGIGAGMEMGMGYGQGQGRQWG